LNGVSFAGTLILVGYSDIRSSYWWKFCCLVTGATNHCKAHHVISSHFV